MFIQTEATPNPATLKFLPGTQVMGSGTANFTDAASAGNSPLALRLFDIDGVSGVFLGSDFVTVTKADEAAWDVVKPRVLAAVMDHFTQGGAVMNEAEGESESGEGDSETVKQIKELIETRVRPAVAQDGGDIVFRSFEAGVVYLHMQGACAGCPSSTATLKNGIENMLRHYVPEVTEVRAVN
ncbi:NifU family protein [Magnetovibrio sp.]|uniref:NifU family protein n=1 Tax=Magnetovibrio sp. TaxID=2024836 RepID=UPI002F929640